jgi:hypothetical protein
MTDKYLGVDHDRQLTVGQVPHLDLTLLTCKIAMMDNAGRVGWRGRAFTIDKLVKAYPPSTHTRLLSVDIANVIAVKTRLGKRQNS